MYKFITEARKYFYCKLLNNSTQCNIGNIIELYFLKDKITRIFNII